MDTTQNSFWIIRAFILALFLAVISSCFGYENRPGPLVLGTRTPPDASALFQMNSVDKGMLLPRMTTAQRDAIPMPANGLVIYNTDLLYPQVYNGAWISLGVAGGGFTEGSVIFANASGLLEEDNGSFFWDDANNRLGIGTITPSVPLEVNGAATITGNITTGIAGQRAVITDVSGVLTDSVTTSTELSYVSGVTSAIQTQLGGKEPTIGTGGGTEYWRGDKTFAVVNSDHLSEGVTNLFFTDTRARTAAVADSITDGITNVAPSQNAVFDALALKVDASTLTNYVEVAGDTMTGSLRTNQSLTVDVDATVKGNLLLTSDPSVGGMLSGANTKSISINGGAALGTANGAQMQAYGISAGGAQGDLILSAGSGSGEVIFRANGAQVGDIDQNGQWEIGSGGGTETHIVHGNLNGSGSGAFAGSLTVMGNVIGSGSGQFSGQLSAGGDIIGSGSGQFAGRLVVGTNLIGSGSGQFSSGVAILAQSPLELQDAAGGENVKIRANATTTTHTLTLPPAQGAVDQILVNDGSGNMSWQDPSGGGGGEKVFLSQNTFDSDSLLADVTCTTGSCSISNSAPLIDRDSKYLAVSLAAQTANISGGVANTAWVDRMLSVSCSVKSSLTDLYMCAYNGTSDEQCVLYGGNDKVQRLVAVMGYNTGETPQWRFKTLVNQTDTFEVDNCTIGEYNPLEIASNSNTQEYTPTYTGFGTVTVSDVQYSYSGDKVTLHGRFLVQGPTAVEARVSLPNGWTVKNNITSAQPAGRWVRGNNVAGQEKAGEVLILGDQSYIRFSTTHYDSAQNPLSPRLGSGLAIATEDIAFTATIPVNELDTQVNAISAAANFSGSAIRWANVTNCAPSTTSATYVVANDADCTFASAEKIGNVITPTVAGDIEHKTAFLPNGKYEVSFDGTLFSGNTSGNFCSFKLEESVTGKLVGRALAQSGSATANEWVNGFKGVIEVNESGGGITNAAFKLYYKRISGTDSCGVDGSTVERQAQISVKPVSQNIVGTFKPAVNGAIMWATANQTGVVYATQTKVQFDNKYDPDGVADLTNERFTVPESGFYTFTAAALWQDLSGSFANATFCNLRTNGVDRGAIARASVTSAGYETTCDSTLSDYFNKNDQVEFWVSHYYNAGTRTILGNAAKSTRFSMVKNDQAGVINKKADLLQVYSPTVTASSCTGWTTGKSSFLPYQTADGNWRVRFNVAGTATLASRTSCTLTVTGITSAPVRQAISCGHTNASAAIGTQQIDISSNTLRCEHISGSTDNYHFSGDIELASKPTFVP